MVSSVLAPLGVSFVDVGASIQCHAPQHTLRTTEWFSTSCFFSVPRSHLSAHCRRRPQRSLSLSCSPCLHSPTNSLCLLLCLLFALTTSEPAGSFRAKWCLLFHPSRRLGSVQQKRAITNFRARTMLHLYSGPCRRFRHSHEVGPNRWYSRRSLVVAGLSLGMSAPNASEMNARWYSPVSLADANGLCTSVTSVPGSCPCCQTRRPSETWLDQSWELHDLSHLAQWFTLCKFHKQCWRSCTRVVVELDPLVAIMLHAARWSLRVTKHRTDDKRSRRRVWCGLQTSKSGEKGLCCCSLIMSSSIDCALVLALAFRVALAFTLSSRLFCSCWMGNQACT